MTSKPDRVLSAEALGELRQLLVAYERGSRRALEYAHPLPAPTGAEVMSTDTYCIKITFAVGVEITREDQDRLFDLTQSICKRYEAANPDRVMWPAGFGAEPVDIWSDEPKFDDSIYAIEVAERERYEGEPHD